MKDQITQLIRENGLRGFLETTAAVCAEVAELDNTPAHEWRDWHNAKIKLLKMSQGMLKY